MDLDKFIENYYYVKIVRVHLWMWFVEHSLRQAFCRFQLRGRYKRRFILLCINITHLDDIQTKEIINWFTGFRVRLDSTSSDFIKPTPQRFKIQQQNKLLTKKQMQTKSCCFTVYKNKFWVNQMQPLSLTFQSLFFSLWFLFVHSRMIFQ